MAIILVVGVDAPHTIPCAAREISQIGPPVAMRAYARSQAQPRGATWPVYYALGSAYSAGASGVGRLAGPGLSAGSVIVNTEPAPGWLAALIVPPSSWQ